MKSKLAKQMYSIAHDPSKKKEGAASPKVKTEVRKVEKKFKRLKKTLGCKCHE
jgi:trehalose-6-phosphate synthase